MSVGNMSGNKPGEKTPLLQEKAPLNDAEGTQSEKPNLLKRILPTGFKDEAKYVGKHIPALTICQMCMWYVQPIAIIFGGHLGKIELDAVGLSCTIINAFGIAIIWGASAACDIAFSHTYGGKNRKMIGVYLQRCLIVLMLTLLPCLAIHMNIEGILLLIGQDPEVCRLVGRYMLIFMPGMTSMFLFMILQKYCICQNIMNHDIWMGVVSHGVHAGLQYLFLYQLNMGIDGSALAQVCFYLVSVLLRVALLVFSKEGRQSWGGWSYQCFGGWGALFRMAFAGGVMMCAEMWSLEIGVLLAGMLGTVQLGAQTIIYNMFVVVNTINNGISSSGMIRMGHLLGAGQPDAAKTAGRVTLLYTMINGIIWMLVLSIFSKDVGKIFTGEKEVLETLSEVVPVLAGYIWADGITVLGRLIFRVASRQKIAAIIVFITYYGCSMPIGYCLMMLTDLELIGLWLGFALCAVLTAVVMTIGWNTCFNWKLISKEAQVRALVVKDDVEVGSSKEHKTSKGEGNHTAINTNVNKIKSELIASWSSSAGSYYAEPVKEEPEDITRSQIIKCCLIISGFVLVFIIGVIVRLSTQYLLDDSYINTKQNFTDSQTGLTTEVSPTYHPIE